MATGPATNAAALPAALLACGVDHVFTNAGTDTAPVIEALAAAQQDNRPLPRFLVTPHENLAMAMAHGYYRFGGRPAAVLLHTTVGSANAVMGVMNAHRDQAAVLVLAGRTPNTEQGQLGSRNAHIHWGQESFDQAAMMREWLKWDYELRAGQPIATLVRRAAAIACSAPAGPVYLTLPREVLAGPAVPAEEVLAPSSPVVPESTAIDELADAVLAAEFPLIVTSSGGRAPEAFAALAELAEGAAIPVAQPFATDANLPSDHEMNFGMEGMSLVGEADLIIVLEAGVPWVGAAAPKAGTTVIQIAADAQYATYPLRGFRTDIAVSGSVTPTLRMLRDACAARGKQASVRRLAKRRRLLVELNGKRRARLAAQVKAAAKQSPISTAWLANCINFAKSDDAIVINELGVPADHLDLTRPRVYMRESTAGGLGFGLGAALGARLVAPKRQIIAVVGDGSYMFGNPTPAHFVARAQGLGTLTIINNNQRWQAVHQAARTMYPDGEAVRADVMPLTELSPAPAYEKVVAASDGYGERVEDPEQLLGAIERGLEAAADGKPAVLNVLTSP